MCTCAVPLREVEEAVRCVLSSDVKVVSLRPNGYATSGKTFSRVAAVTGREESAEELLKGLKRRLWKLEQKTRHLARPKVACLEWLDPLITAGNWIPELVSIAGGECTLAEAGEHSTKLAWESLVKYQPDVIVLMPCGFKIAQTQAELPGFTARPQWQALSAVQNNKVFIVDGNAYLNRSGPRIVDSAEILGGDFTSRCVCGVGTGRFISSDHGSLKVSVVSPFFFLFSLLFFSSAILSCTL